MHTTFKAALVVATILVALVVSIRPGPAADNSHLALTISIDGAIGPAAASYVKDGLAKAAERHAEIVILRLNTPGGLSTSMREIIADVLASPVPVVGYVAPSGAHAASAGTYILYATHLAAMAPGTNIGAATPVQIGGPIPGLPGSTPDKGGKDQKDGGHPSETKDAMTAKVTNDAVAFIRSLAELRGRNADWAEKAVRDAATSPPTLRCKPTSLISPRVIRPTCSGRSMAGPSSCPAARRNAWRPGTPRSRPSIPPGSRARLRSSPTPTSHSFS